MWSSAVRKFFYSGRQPYLLVLFAGSRFIGYFFSSTTDRYKVDGSVNLDDFNEELGTDIDSDHYESVGGLIIEQLERIPKTGDVVRIDNCKFTVIDMDSNRVESVAVDVQPVKKEKETEE